LQERKNLIGQKLNEKHNNWGSMLLGLGVLMSVAGPLNTFFRTGASLPSGAVLRMCFGLAVCFGSGLGIGWAAGCLPCL
jgi:hypothetical protein